VKIILIHGIHTEGVSLVEGMIPYLSEWTVKYPDYGYILGLETRIVNPIIVGALQAFVDPDDILIGHSNGCAIAYDLMRSGAKVAGAIFINAALENNIARPAGCPWIHVYYNPGDQITEAAQIAARLGITDPVWGEMGHTGYIGTDKFIPSTNCGATPPLPAVVGHSDFFSPHTNLAGWSTYLANDLRIRLKAAA
jgi:pimeloyl-ACP methyl ester carboxylesterase